VNTTPCTILYADDDSDDRLLWSESITMNGLHADMVYVANGQEAISYIQTTAANLPSLVILDLNMPKMNGKETLHYLKAHPYYQTIPVIILSTSDNQSEREFCTAAGALSYFVKPQSMSGYYPIVKACMPYVGGA